MYGKDVEVRQTEERAARVYRDYGPVVYRRCLRILRDRDAARDVTQEVFVKLVRNLKKLDDRDDLLPWLYRVATNHCLNMLRDARRRGEQQLPESFEIAAADRGDVLPSRQLAVRILQRFDRETQTVALGVLVDGMEHEEVARTLGISRRTVARKLDRFLLNAKKFVARGGA